MRKEMTAVITGGVLFMTMFIGHVNRFMLFCVIQIAGMRIGKYRQDSPGQDDRYQKQFGYYLMHKVA